MSVRVLIAAAAVSLGMGQAADAATVKYNLRYEDSVLEDVWIYFDDADEELWFDKLSIHGSAWKLPSLFQGAQKGDLFEAYAEIEKDDEYGEYIASYCYVGFFKCTAKSIGNIFVQPDFYIVADAFAVWNDGKTLTLTSWGRWDGDGFDIIGEGYTGYADAITSTFTIIQPAPVPLPATAALLPLGLGALAMMRRRQKRV